MESSGTTSQAQGTPDFRCVHCGFPVKTLHIQYSPGNIRLMKCGNCGAVADGYIECEIMILILDLILHKPKAYRHVFYNMFSKETVNFESLLWKLVFAFLVLDVYKMWVFSTNEREGPFPASVMSLLLEFVKMLCGVIFGNLVCLWVVIYTTRKSLSASTGMHGWKEILFAVIVSSYFKIFLLAMMVWEFPSSVIVIIDIFIISSNVVALKGMGYRCVDPSLKIGAARKVVSRIVAMQETRFGICWLKTQGPINWKSESFLFSFICFPVG